MEIKKDGEVENLALEMFKEMCCDSCSCKSETDHTQK